MEVRIKVNTTIGSYLSMPIDEEIADALLENMSDLGVVFFNTSKSNKVVINTDHVVAIEKIKKRKWF